MNQTFRALSNPGYRVFLLAIFISNIGSAVQEVAERWLVLDLTGSAVWLGIVAACVRVPFIVLAPIGGVLADRYNRRGLLGVAQMIQILPAVALAIMVPAHLARPWHFAVAAVLLGLGNALAFPTTMALQRDIVKKEDLRSAMAVQVGQFHLARALGPIAATGVFAVIGLVYAFHFNVASYIPLLLFCFAGWRAAKVMAPSGPPKPAPPMLAALGQGVQFASKNDAVRLLLISCAIVGALLMTYPALFPMIAKNVGQGAAGNAYLGAATGAGAFAGALLMPTIVGKRNWVSVLAAMTVLGGLAMIGIGWAPNIWIACVFAAIASLAGAAYSTVTASTLQLLAGGEFIGRVMSLNFVAFNLGLVVGSLGIGALASRATDSFLPLAAAGGAAIVFSLYLLAKKSVGVPKPAA